MQCRGRGEIHVPRLRVVDDLVDRVEARQPYDSSILLIGDQHLGINANGFWFVGRIFGGLST